MNELKNFQVAISFSDENSWLAKDLYHFLEEEGIRSFFYKQNPDLTGGKLTDKIREIYSYSTINCIIWSSEYAKKNFDSIVSTELQVMEERHIRKNEFDSLIILNQDESEIHRKFGDITYHSLKGIGLFNFRNAIVLRLLRLFSIEKNGEHHKIYHPPGDIRSRGLMTFCRFEIDSNFKQDPNWDKYGDVVLKITDSVRSIRKGHKVYLIPSGRVSSLLCNSILLRNNPEALQLKKKITERFVEKNIDRKLTGFLFLRLYQDMDYPYAYNFEYDDHLNQGLYNYRW